MKIFAVIVFLEFGVFVDGNEVSAVSVMEGDSVTLNTGVTINPKDRNKWYFNNIRITEITGDQSKICTDVQCDERFRDRLKLDNQTGSLTIMNTRNTDSGLYQLETINSDISGQSIMSIKIFSVTVTDMFVMEGDSVTLNTDVKRTQQDDIKWYFNDTLIAQILGDQNKICTDVQCNEGTERFRDRLKLDHQTGSLTIMNTTNTDTGLYHLQIINSGISEKTFSVAVRGFSSDEQVKIKTKSVKEGESVTLNPCETKHPNYVTMKWHFNDVLIAEITGDQSKICTDDQCDERFRDRLKLDHQTGSLTIMNIRNTDSGEYKLQISSSRFSVRRRRRRSISITSITSIRSFSVFVIDLKSDTTGVSAAAVAGIVVTVVVLLSTAVVAVIYYRHHRNYRRAAQNEDGGL